MQEIKKIFAQLRKGDKKALARCITIVENELPGYEELLASLTFEKEVPVIGITGPPGAGKSTLINALISKFTSQNKKTGVIAIDPTSPFNFGSLLGDRLRMAEHFNSEQVFIRSLATRGSLGGLSAKTIEVCDVMKNSDLDLVIVETVGVGQSEVEIAGLADVTVLVLVPESGDEVQTLKSGIMEIADVFVVNKSDRPGADLFAKNLLALVQSRHTDIPVIQTTASTGEGIDKLADTVMRGPLDRRISRKNYLLAEKAFQLLQNKRMRGVNKAGLQKLLENESGKKNFNLYLWIDRCF